MEDIHIYIGSGAVVVATILSIALASYIRKTPSQALPEPVKTIEEPVETIISETVNSVDFDGSSCTDTGKGQFYIQSPSGSSENGADVFFYYDDKVLMESLGFSASDFDGSKITYIYVDGIEARTGQLSDTQGSIELSGDMLSIGSHKVEAVQFSENNPENNVITYKSCIYEVKDYAES